MTTQEIIKLNDSEILAERLLDGEITKAEGVSWDDAWDHAQYLIDQAFSKSTHETYAQGAKRYVRYCISQQQPPFPVNEEKLLRWVGALHAAEASPRTTQTYLVGITKFCEYRFGKDPRTAKLKDLVNRRARQIPPKRVHACGEEDFFKLCQQCDDTSLDGLRDLTIILFMLFGAMRRGEISNLQWSWVQPDEADPDSLSINLRQAKNIGKRATAGHIKLTPIPDLGRFCPVYCFKKWKERFEAEFEKTIDARTQKNRKTLRRFNGDFKAAKQYIVKGRYKSTSTMSGYEIAMQAKSPNDRQKIENTTDIENLTRVLVEQGQRFVFQGVKITPARHNGEGEVASPRKETLTGKRLDESNVGTMIKRLITTAGLGHLRIRGHSFRRGILTQLADKGVALQHLQDVARHANVNTTRIYTDTANKASATDLFSGVKMPLRS